MIVVSQTLRGFKMIACGWPVTHNRGAARLNNVANSAQRITEVFRVVFLIATAKQRHQLTVKVNLFESREEVIPVTLCFAIVPGWDAQQQNVIPFGSSLLLCNVMHIGNVFTKLF